MQKSLDGNNFVMYLTHNKGKSVDAERFVKILKGKIYKKISANDSKSYLHKLLDEKNKAYQGLSFYW